MLQSLLNVGKFQCRTGSLFFQLYDVLIMVVVALIGILIFRRIAATEFQVSVLITGVPTGALI